MFVKTFSAWKQRFAIILYLIHRFHLLPVYLWWYRKIMLEIVWCLLDHFYVITSPHVHACFLTHLVHHMATQKGCVLLLYEWMPSVDGVTKQGLQHSWTEGSDESTEREICIRYMQAWAPLCARNVSRFLSLLLYTTQLHIIVYNYMPIANKERSLLVTKHMWSTARVIVFILDQFWLILEIYAPTHYMDWDWINMHMKVSGC